MTPSWPSIAAALTVNADDYILLNYLQTLEISLNGETGFAFSRNIILGRGWVTVLLLLLNDRHRQVPDEPVTEPLRTHRQSVWSTMLGNIPLPLSVAVSS